MVNVGEDVVDVLDADAESNQSRGDARSGLLLIAELGVGRGGGMNGEGTGVADVGEVGEEFEALDKLLTGFLAACDLEDDHGAAFAFEVFEVLVVFGVGFEAGKTNRSDAGLVLEVAGDSVGVFAVAFHAQRQGFDALQGDPGVVRRKGGAEVAKRDGAHAQDVGKRGERLGQVVPPTQAVVGGVGIIEKRMFASGPVEGAGVDDDPADAGAVSAEPFGEGVNDDVRPVLDGLAEVGRGEGGVDDEGQAMGVGDAGDRFQVGNLAGGVGDGLAEDGAGFVVNRIGKSLRILGIDKFDGDPEGREDVVELGVAAAVKVAGGDDVVASLGEVDDGVEDGGGTGSEGEATHFRSAFHEGNALFEDVVGRIHDPRIDVAQLLQGEEIGGVLRGVKDVGCGAVDGDAAGFGGGVRLMAAVKAKGFELHGTVIERIEAESSGEPGDGASNLKKLAQVLEDVAGADLVGVF